MPEFAEVNVQVRYLRERCVGWQVQEMGLTGRSHCKNLDVAERASVVHDFGVGNTITDITQRGKQVILRTSKGVMTSHLMFRGRWSLADEPFISNYKHHRDLPTAKSNTFWIINTDGKRLNFHDPEYKGHVSVYLDEMDPAGLHGLTKLGPDVVVMPETDPSFQDPWDLDAFAQKTSRSRQAIKAFLLDQKRQSGIGNMYACESLYAARIDPRRPAKSLSSDEVSSLHEAVQDVIRRAIDTDLDYDSVLAIYRKEHDPEGRAVDVIKVSGRDTYWVPEQQV